METNRQRKRHGRFQFLTIEGAFLGQCSRFKLHGRVRLEVPWHYHACELITYRNNERWMFASWLRNGVVCSMPTVAGTREAVEYSGLLVMGLNLASWKASEDARSLILYSTWATESQGLERMVSCCLWLGEYRQLC